MEEKSVGERCIALWGEGNEIWHMIEEGSELVAALCHKRRGRYNNDHVYEEIADCSILLDHMDMIFNETKPDFVVPDSSEKSYAITLEIISTVGQLQVVLVRYLRAGEKGKIKFLLHAFRQCLNNLILTSNINTIAKWKEIKLERTLKLVEREENARRMEAKE